MALSLDLDAMRFLIRRGKVEWQRHALERMAERGILREEVKEVLLRGEVIEEYPEDYPFPSGLFLGKAAARPLHVVASINSTVGMVYIITAYEPSDDRFEPDLKTRRKK